MKSFQQIRNPDKFDNLQETKLCGKKQYETERKIKIANVRKRLYNLPTALHSKAFDEIRILFFTTKIILAEWECTIY